MRDKFWKYFIDAESALGSREISRKQIAEFEKRLHALVETDWEIGPGNGGLTRLSLSPSPSDTVNINKAKKLLQAAPSIPGWEFTLYKPRRPSWDLVFSVISDRGERRVDGTKWEFVLYSFEDGTFDILFRPDTRCSGSMDPAVLEHAATVIVDGEVGERVRLERIGEISVVTEWASDEKQAAQRLKPGLLADLLDEAMETSES